VGWKGLMEKRGGNRGSVWIYARNWEGDEVKKVVQRKVHLRKEFQGLGTLGAAGGGGPQRKGYSAESHRSQKVKGEKKKLFWGDDAIRQKGALGKQNDGGMLRYTKHILTDWVEEQQNSITDVLLYRC